MPAVASSILDARGRRWLLILFVLAAGTRVGWVTARFAGEGRPAALQYPDEEAYLRVARSLAAGEGLVDEFGFRATYMPAYPAFIAVFTLLPRPLLGARIAQALLGAWVAPATFLLAERWCRLSRGGPSAGGAGPNGIGPLAGLAAAFDPFLIFFSGLLLTETLFAATLVTAWLFVLPMGAARAGVRPGQAVLAGLMLWLCVMLRPSAAILVLLVPVAVMVNRRFAWPGIGAAAAVVAIVMLGLFPWAARNRATTGQWRWLTTRGGVSLYDGLRHGAAGASDLAHIRKLPESAGLSETRWDEYFRNQAWTAARRDPLRVARLAWVKFRRTWSLTPNVETHRHGPAALVSAAWMVVLLVSAAVGWWRHRRAVRSWLILLLPVAAFTLLHTVFVGSVRYRVPVMPMVMVLAAAGVSEAVARGRLRRRR